MHGGNYTGGGRGGASRAVVTPILSGLRLFEFLLENLNMRSKTVQGIFVRTWGIMGGGGGGG